MNLSERETRSIERLREHLAECTVLLKSNGMFPLEKTGEIAAYGNGVRHTVKGGTGSGEVNSRYFINVEEGLEAAGFTISTKGWLDSYDRIREQARKDFLQSIRTKAKQEKINIIAASMGAVQKEPDYEIPLEGSGEAAVYVLSRISGEGNDRLLEAGDFLLTRTEIHDILLLEERFERFMLVLNTGGPVDLTPVRSVSNILVLSQLGVETGRALADILLGKACPSGKLATTWSAYSDYADAPFGDPDDTVYSEGIYVGYRYCDAAGKTPLFPFGFGLGYTTFEIGSGKISIEGSVVTAAAEVRNRGKFKGKETLQLYVSAPAGKISKEVRSLAGFAKTRELSPGEAEEVRVCFDLREISSFDTESASYILEEGEYLLCFGTSSRDLKEIGVLTLEKTIPVRKVRNAFGCPEIREYEPLKTAHINTDNLPHYSIDPECIETEIIQYGRKPEIPELLKDLSDEELAYLGIGSFDPKGGLSSIIGSASKKVAGAAGESTSQLAAKGIPSIVMADGPAGLRLSKTYYVDKKGIHSFGSPIPETMIEMMPVLIRKILTRKPRIPKNAAVYHQYTTALPIGTAIAQSWNTEFAEICGDIVGNEMEEYGVQLWLAPGMNIHRNVLCGRNFEYLSEDPLITGRIAAALTRGVQKHKNCGVTIKHFAANNQETNRYANNSIVSERALREIYLRGFERCIKESRPAALMTSYNLLNGVHTSERRDLIHDVLRDEFRFDGVVMTDWVVAQLVLSKGSKYPAPDPAKVAKAGHSLFMPGSKKDYSQLISGLKNGTVQREDLMENASYLYKAAKQQNEKRDLH